MPAGERKRGEGQNGRGAWRYVRHNIYAPLALTHASAGHVFPSRHFSCPLALAHASAGHALPSCRADAGYHAVAGQIEVLGKLTVMFAGLPILFAVIEQIQSFL